MVTLRADPHLPKPGKPQGHSSALAKKGKASSVPDDAEEDENRYEDRLSRLRPNHKLPEFKLRCWARMLVNGTHDSEDKPPDLPFFTGKSNKVKGRAPNTTDCEARNSTADGVESKIRMRSAILQQLKDLKSLNNDRVISDDEFVGQKEKLLRELSAL
ncbi:uncharacterized protein [Porites lutea]|uniref:uncharacterized protein isoform X2 n=1 Tax=Porites lutea TaxID=51062 RepID=UPI003CC5AA3E